VIWARLETTLRWVSMTPLGNPVVPLEYGRKSRSSRGSIRTSGGSPLLARSSPNGVAPGASPKTKISRTPARFAASRAASSNGGTVSSLFAAESSSWRASSPVVLSGFAGVTTPPRDAAACTAMAYSGRLGL
jgi:hypothetical protein